MSAGTAHAERETAFIGMGSNLGDRIGYLHRAVQGLARHPRIDVVAASPVYETAAHTKDPAEQQPDYLNAVVQVQTALSPEALLRYCLDLEAASGRARAESTRWAPRTLDLDLLVYDAVVQQSDVLVLPHPRLGDRRFVLQPLADLAPDLFVPAPFAATASALLARCPDTARLRRTCHMLTT